MEETKAETYIVKMVLSKAYFSGDPLYENQVENYQFVAIDANSVLDACLRARATYGGYAVDAVKAEGWSE